ncbi:unnamed protein product [Trichogramma brassicae]|uniref:Uncharacterized protein n=1 Tax=Trichogramma brassicae TaxID=86971 RepID=A0A6H5I3C9_9HYME|nr:unnamed protein product [Trichogramma brassicae]
MARVHHECVVFPSKPYREQRVFSYRTKEPFKENQEIKWTAKHIKTHYKSIQDFSEHLVKNPELLTIKHGADESSISAHLLTSSSNSHHIILYDSDLVAEFDNNNDMFADATFKVSPDINGVTQVLTIMCKKYSTSLDYRVFGPVIHRSQSLNDDFIFILADIRTEKTDSEKNDSEKIDSEKNVSEKIDSEKNDLEKIDSESVDSDNENSDDLEDFEYLSNNFSINSMH